MEGYLRTVRSTACETVKGTVFDDWANKNGILVAITRILKVADNFIQICEFYLNVLGTPRLSPHGTGEFNTPDRAGSIERSLGFDKRRCGPSGYPELFADDRCNESGNTTQFHFYREKSCFVMSTNNRKSLLSLGSDGEFYKPWFRSARHIGHLCLLSSRWDVLHKRGRVVAGHTGKEQTDCEGVGKDE